MHVRFWQAGLLILMALAAYGPLMAQAQPGKRQPASTVGGTPTTGPARIPGVATDSLSPDSTRRRIEPVEIKPDTRWLSREDLFEHRDYLHTYRYDFASTHLYDELEFAPGFVQTLGQISKPYQVFYQGFNEQYFRRPFWRDPVMGRYNRYILNGETQTRYLDTRTPYVNFQFMQGGRKLQLSSVTASVNVSPFVNVTAYTKSRQAVGAYPQFVSDDRILYASTNFHTAKLRYHGFFNFTFNEAGGLINGGTFREQDSLYRVDEGVIIDNSFFYNGAFLKNQSRTMLDNADFKTIVKSLNLDHYYHLIGTPQDSTPGDHRLSLRHVAGYEYAYQRFFDNSIDSARLSTHLVPVYPTLAPGNRRLGESMITNRGHTFGAASYTFDGPFRFNAQAEIGYENLRLLQDSTAVSQNTFRQQVKGRLQFSLMDARLDVERRISNLFSPETHSALEVDLFPWPARSPYHVVGADTTEKDSLFLKKEPPVYVRRDTTGIRAWERFRPLRLYGRAEVNDLNPSLFQTWFRPDSSNAFQPDAGLKNQQFRSYRVGMAWRQAVPVLRGDTLLPNHAFVHGFLSRASRMITYDAGLKMHQAPDGAALTWYGAVVGFRYRFLRKLYLETEATFQQSRGSEDKFLSLYERYLPRISGKTSFFYDNRNLSIAGILRLGVDIYYHTAYVGQTVDPLSREFFPANYEIPGYARVDAFFATQIKRAYIYAKMIHINEGILMAGYYTTPFYPMLERTFTLGVNWSFYD